MQNFRHAIVVPVNTRFGFVVDGHWAVGGKNEEKMRSKIVGVIPSYCGEVGLNTEFSTLHDVIKERTLTLCDPYAKRPHFVLDAPRTFGGEIETLRVYRAPYVGSNRPTFEELFGELFERRPLVNFNTPQTNREILLALHVDTTCELLTLPKRKEPLPKPKPKLVYTPLGFRFK